MAEDPNPPAPAEQEPGRDYLAEAMKIAAGTGRFVAEDKHVIALAAEQARTVKDLKTAVEIVASFLLLSGPDVNEIVVPPDVMRRVRAGHFRVYIKTMPDGAIAVVKVPTQRPQAGPVPTAGPRSVQ